jgi:hypothetical protein
MLRDAATGKVTQLPDEIKIIAGSYSRGLLGGSRGEQGAAPAQGLHVDRPWAEDVLWEQTRGKWGAEATELVCSPASTSETKEIVNRSKSNRAPGLDGVQSSALKLIILACEKGGGDKAGGPYAAITFLTNLLNAILLNPVPPATLFRAELVYFYKKGDQLDLKNYRGIALQSVLNKMAASHTACRIQETSHTLSLLHPSQGAARKGSHAGVQAANIVALNSVVYMSCKPGTHTIPIRTLKFVTFVFVAVVSRDLAYFRS